MTYVIEVEGQPVIMTKSYGQALFWFHEYTEKRGKKAVMKNGRGQVILPAVVQ